jgi:hypothetical protein
VGISFTEGAAMTDAGKTSKAEGSVKRAADFTSNVRTIIAAIVGIAVGIFFAGIHWNELKTKIEDAYNYGVNNTKDISVIKVTVATLVQFRDDLSQWGRPPTESPKLSGLPGGVSYQPTVCPEGSYMVGIDSTGSTGEAKYCIGCLVSVRAICRSLKAEK